MSKSYFKNTTNVPLVLDSNKIDQIKIPNLKKQTKLKAVNSNYQLDKQGNNIDRNKKQNQKKKIPNLLISRRDFQKSEQEQEKQNEKKISNQNGISKTVPVSWQKKKKNVHKQKKHKLFEGLNKNKKPSQKKTKTKKKKKGWFQNPKVRGTDQTRNKSQKKNADLQKYINQQLNVFWMKYNTNPDCWPFVGPVDLEQFPEYKTVIQKPMDLSLIKLKLDTNQYCDDYSQLSNDFRLMFQNCKVFNEPYSIYYQIADKILKQFDDDWKDFEQDLKGCVSKWKEMKNNHPLRLTQNTNKQIKAIHKDYQIRPKKQKQPFQANSNNLINLKIDSRSRSTLKRKPKTGTTNVETTTNRDLKQNILKKKIKNEKNSKKKKPPAVSSSFSSDVSSYSSSSSLSLSTSNSLLSSFSSSSFSFSEESHSFGSISSYSTDVSSSELISSDSKLSMKNESLNKKKKKTKKNSKKNSKIQNNNKNKRKNNSNNKNNNNNNINNNNNNNNNSNNNIINKNNILLPNNSRKRSILKNKVINNFDSTKKKRKKINKTNYKKKFQEKQLPNYANLNKQINLTQINDVKYAHNKNNNQNGNNNNNITNAIMQGFKNYYNYDYNSPQSQNNHNSVHNNFIFNNNYSTRNLSNMSVEQTNNQNIHNSNLNLPIFNYQKTNNFKNKQKSFPKIVEIRKQSPKTRYNKIPTFQKIKTLYKNNPQNIQIINNNNLPMTSHNRVDLLTNKPETAQLFNHHKKQKQQISFNDITDQNNLISKTKIFKDNKSKYEKNIKTNNNSLMKQRKPFVNIEQKKTLVDNGFKYFFQQKPNKIRKKLEYFLKSNPQTEKYLKGIREGLKLSQQLSIHLLYLLHQSTSKQFKLFSIHPSLNSINLSTHSKNDPISKLDKSNQKKLQKKNNNNLIIKSNINTNTNNNTKNNNINNNNDNNNNNTNTNPNIKVNTNMHYHKEKVYDLLKDISKLEIKEREILYQMICKNFDQYVSVITNDNLEQNVEIDFSIMETKHLNYIINFMKKGKFQQRRYLNSIDIKDTEIERNIKNADFKNNYTNEIFLKEKKTQPIQQQQNNFLNSNHSNDKSYLLKNYDSKKERNSNILESFDMNNFYNQENNIRNENINIFSKQFQHQFNKQDKGNQNNKSKSSLLPNQNRNNTQSKRINENNKENCNGSGDDNNNNNVDHRNYNKRENSKELKEKSSMQNTPLEIIEFDFNTFETTHRKTTVLDFENIGLSTIDDPNTSINENNSFGNRNEHII
ncbi:transcription intermediary factor [Anaeramoeba flamelloides]|uniref:Transcription intermediary factor n=1 Tax=Anaeramoeba flamelloides TaxID=1746091 RepID=A0AAV7YNE0_9EUKA|nr:transcription intermediary factor [Anaeramoeba flamelloides]